MKKKILILFMASFLLFFAGVAITLHLVFQTTANLNSLIGMHNVEIVRQDLVINVQKVQSDLYTTGTSFGKELDSIVDNVFRLNKGVEKCGSCHHKAEIADRIKELQEMTELYKEALSYFITSTADSKRVERLQVVAADIGESIITKSLEMAQTANNSLQKRTQESLIKVKKTKIILWVTIFVVLFLTIFIAVYLIKSITKPISELIQANRKIRRGDLGYTSSYQGKDEFKELIESFNQMSKALLKNNEEILAHMARNQTILQTSIDGFVLFDQVGNILDVNPAFCEMVEDDEDELLKKKITDIEEFGVKFHDDASWEEIKQARFMLFEVEHKTKKGFITNAEISATYTELEGQGSYFCFIRDITERKKMEDELLKVQKLESLGILAGGIAHDFNNLLTAILGNIDLAMMRQDPHEKTYTLLMNAKKASGRAQNLTQQLLTFSRGGEPVKEPTAIGPLVEESTNFILSGANVRCEYRLSTDLWLIDADKGQIGQVVQNITINANQAMPGGGVITIKAENVSLKDTVGLPLRAGKYVKLRFTDQGIGISTKYITKIFDPYFTTKKTGTGLGLPVCYSIVEKHNGHILVESEPNVGTTFIIYLPAIGEEGRVESLALKDKVLTGSGRVLIMDDEEDVRNIVSEILIFLGYEPDAAKDGMEAVEMYIKAKRSGNPYAAVIIDLTIPGGMGGKETIEYLREFDPEVKAIVASGYSNDPILAEFKRYGFSGVASKPFDTKHLSKILYDLCMK